MPTKKVISKAAKADNRAGTNQTVYSRIQVRRDTETNWYLHRTDTPLEGEICLTLDGQDAGQFKIGDGVKDWENLDYYAGGGNAEVIVGKDDPLTADPDLPEGTLWYPFDYDFPDKEVCLQILVVTPPLDAKVWKRVDPDLHMYMEDVANEPDPSKANEGDLWYQTDVLDLYVLCGGVWVPAVGFQEKAYLPLTGGEMTGPLIIHNSTSNGSVIDFQAKDRKDGFTLEQDGQIKAKGASVDPQDEDNLVTKKYVDEMISGNVGGIDDHYLIKDQNIGQTVLGHVAFAAHPDENPNKEATFRRTRITRSEVRTRSHILGNPTTEYKDGTTHGNIDDRAHGKASEIILRNCENSPETISSDWDPEVNEKTTNKVMIESYDYDRIERIHYLKSNVREGSNTGFDWESGEGKPKGHATNLPVDHTRWRQREETADVAGWYADKEGAPQRFITWVVDPDDPDWDQRHRDKNKQGGYVSDSCLPEHRAANKAYVDRQISERGVGKGTDLCADGADDPSLEVGGFWRARDYHDQCSRIYIKIA